VGCREQPLDVGLDRDVRVSHRFVLQRCLGHPGRRGGLLPEARVGQEAGAALRVVNDRHFEQPVAVDLPGEHLLGQEGQVRDVLDDGLGDAAARVTDHRRVAELQAEHDRRVDPVVQAGDDQHLRGGRGEFDGRVVAGELLVAVQQRGHPGHGLLRFLRARPRHGPRAPAFSGHCPP